MDANTGRNRHPTRADRADPGALGEQIPVEKEDYIDMQTGLGGSGPGFVFLIIEAMIDAGVQMGFSRADAQTIVLQTIAGSVALVKETGKHPAELRNLVTSAGGTTAAGLYEMERAGIRTALADAIFARIIVAKNWEECNSVIVVVAR
ncbi:MAG: pyrroline-5-carboxylate reductase dimerization domain-containing protein [Caldilineaceae bacterium]